MHTIYSSVVAGLLVVALSVTGAACKKEPVAMTPDPRRDAKSEQSRKIAETTQKLVAARVNGIDVNMRELIREMNLVAQKDTARDEKTAIISTKIKART
jgi:hypothetical protein